ncbi:MAG: hydroxylamine reductase, partial [Phycisphaerae bacterium]|nr:hydroxylamine reductase [Phycisphaerae bacterium]
MFCYQCEQTAKGTGCTTHGVCGKDPDTAALQDLLIHMAEGVAQYAHRSRQLGARNHDADVFVVEALFTTVTNVDFDPQRLAELVRKGAAVRERARQTYHDACQKADKKPDQLTGDAELQPAADLDEMIRQGQAVTIQRR